MPFSAEVNAETRTPQGVTISTLYRHSRHTTLADTLQWLEHVTRALSRQHSLAFVTIRDDAGSVVKAYRWQHSGSARQYCPSKRRRFR